MSIFGNKQHSLLELKINGEDIDDDDEDDYDLPEDDDEDVSEDYGDDEGMEDEDYDLPEDEEAPEDQADQAAEDAGDDENYDLPEDDAEGGDNANQAPADDAGAGDGGDGGEENYDLDPNAAGGGDAGTEGGGDAGGEAGAEGGAEGGGEGQEGGDQQQGGGNQQVEDPTDLVKDQEQKEAEEKIYNSLTDQQKNLRALKLKTQFKNVHTEMISTLDSISNIPKTPKNIEIISRIIAKLSEANVMIVDYVAYNFDVTPYIANFVEYLKYLNILRTITKVLNMMVEENRKDA